MNVPQNPLVNEAVKLFVEQKTSEVVSNVEVLVASVRLYRDADPHFKQTISMLVDAEAGLGADDPLEGSIVVEVSPPASDQSAPTRRKRRGVVDG